MKWYLAFLIAGLAFSQQPTKSTPTATELENQELGAALSDANNSPSDMIRVLEVFLKKHPQPAQLKEIEQVMARASIDLKDDRRTVLYGQRALVANPADMLILDRVARALLNLGGAENAAKSLQYSKQFEENIRKAAAPEGRDAARKQEERDRGLARAFLYESQAKTILGEKADAEHLAAESFTTYPSEEAARTWSKTLENLGRQKDAVAHLADAFAIPDPRATEADRTEDRRALGELYRKLHHSEKGLGDEILAAYDRTSAQVEAHRNQLKAMDPNLAATEPTQFTITRLDGSKLPLASLKGSVVVLDFWATWCQPCRAQHPLYEKVKEKFKDRSDVVFLAVDTDEERDLVAPFLDQQKWSKSVYFEDGLQRFLQVTSIPTTILFDKQGKLASRMNGFLPEKFVEQLTDRIQNALTEPGR